MLDKSRSSSTNNDGDRDESINNDELGHIQGFTNLNIGNNNNLDKKREDFNFSGNNYGQGPLGTGGILKNK
jgi:hypothetical protein